MTISLRLPNATGVVPPGIFGVTARPHAVVSRDWTESRQGEMFFVRAGGSPVTFGAAVSRPYKLLPRSNRFVYSVARLDTGWQHAILACSRGGQGTDASGRAVDGNVGGV